MGTLRLIGRGLMDTLESLLPFVLLTLAWWICLCLVIPAPAATVTLAAMTDPRRAVARPDWREALDVARRSLWRGWGVVLPFLPFVAVLLVNLSFYGGGTDRWGVLVPLWTLLLLFALAGSLYALAVAGLTDATAWSATKRAGLLVVQRPGQAPRGRRRGSLRDRGRRGAGGAAGDARSRADRRRCQPGSPRWSRIAGARSAGTNR